MIGIYIIMIILQRSPVIILGNINLYTTKHVCSRFNAFLQQFKSRHVGWNSNYLILRSKWQQIHFWDIIFYQK